MDNYRSLTNLLKHGEPHQAEEAAAQLRAAGVRAVQPLLESLGDRSAFTRLLDPFFRYFDKPGRLDMKTPEKLLNERVEGILRDIGPAALPELVRGFDHPDFRVREAAARVMARQDRAAIPYLIDSMRSPRAKYLPGDVLAAIGKSAGKAAIDPLVAFLKAEPVGSAAWDSADAALSGLLHTPTRKTVLSKRSHLVWAWVLAIAALLGGIALGLWAEIGLWPSVILGLVVGYALWVGVLHESGSQNEGTADFVIFLIECVSAPFVYHEKVKGYRASKLTRKRMAKKYALPE